MSSTQEKWDLVVLGGGTAGIVAAKTAAGLGASVLLIERDRTGGDCLWTGCVPSKSILAAAHVAALARSGSNMGVNVSGLTVDFPTVMNHVQSSINQIAPQDSTSALAEAGVIVIHGDAKFSSQRTIDVNGKTLDFGKAIIATGATPTVPPIPGLQESPYLTSENIWQLETLPKKLVVLGAGSIGCELGQAFGRLGSTVTLIDAADQILPREDESASKILEERLRGEGIEIATSAKVQRVESDDKGRGKIIYQDVAGNTVQLEFDRLLVAIGRTPRTKNIGLENAGVVLDDRNFIKTSKSLRTSNTKIWAAGDVTGHPQFTHVAGVHGSTAGSNAILGLSRKAEVKLIPRVTFTDPEVAAVGVAPSAADQSFRILERSNRHVDRAITESRQEGITKLVVDSKGRVVGGMIVGPRAGENLAEVTMAIRTKMKTRTLAAIVHPYPTFGDGLWNIAVADVRTQLGSPTIKLLLKVLKKVAQL